MVGGDDTPPGVGTGESAGVMVLACASVSSADSRIDGSKGGGPSRAHRRDSYFERMKDSILLERDTS